MPIPSLDFLTAALIALALALPLLAVGAAIELRQYRRLATRTDAWTVGLFADGAAGGDRPEELGLVSACVTLSPAPLGQLQVLVRRLIGGRVEVRHRLADRTRREVLLRLREAAHARGATAVLGVRLTDVRLGTGMVAQIAYGTAVRGTVTDGGAGGDGPAGPAEALGSPPPRPWLLAGLVAAGTFAAILGALVAPGLERLAEDFPALGRLLRLVPFL